MYDDYDAADDDNDDDDDDNDDDELWWSIYKQHRLFSILSRS